jgi:hypothetical protein
MMVSKQIITTLIAVLVLSASISYIVTTGVGPRQTTVISPSILPSYITSYLSSYITNYRNYTLTTTATSYSTATSVTTLTTQITSYVTSYITSVETATVTTTQTIAALTTSLQTKSQNAYNLSINSFEGNRCVSCMLAPRPYWDNQQYQFRAMEPYIAYDGKTGNVYVAFMLLGYDGWLHVALSRSTDGGKTFSFPFVFPQQAGYDPSVAVDGAGNVYVAFAAGPQLQGYQENVIVAKSTDMGNTFTYTNVNTSLYHTYWADRPFMTVDPKTGYIYITWQDNRNGDLQIFFSISTDGGKTFSENKMIWGQSGWGRVALDSSGNIYVADHYNVMKSTDGGSTFQILPFHNPNTEKGFDISVDQYGYVYVAGISKNEGVWFAYSHDGGSSWSQPSILNTAGTVAIHAPTIASDSGKVYVAWIDDRTGQWRTYLSYSTDGGLSFSPNILVSDQDGGESGQTWIGQDFMSITLINGMPLVVWGDARNYSADIYAAIGTHSPELLYPFVQTNPPTVSYGNGFVQIELNYVDNESISYQKQVLVVANLVDSTNRTVSETGTMAEVWSGQHLSSGIVFLGLNHGQYVAYVYVISTSGVRLSQITKISVSV